MTLFVRACAAACLSAAMIVGPAPLFAQKNGLVLTYPHSVRSLGMGGAGVADDTEPACAFFNPANLATLHGVAGSFGYGQLAPDLADDLFWMNVGFGAGYSAPISDAVRFGAGVDVRYARLDYGDVQITDITGSIISTANSYEHDVSVALGTGLTFGDVLHIAVGGAMKPYKGELAPTFYGDAGSSADALAFDFGLRLAAYARTDIVSIIPSVGVSYLNAGGDIDSTNQFYSAELPASIRAGFSIRAETMSLPELDDMLDTTIPLLVLSLNADVEDPQTGSSSSTAYHVGGEVVFLQFLSVRVGYTDDGGSKGDATYGFGLGGRLWQLWGRLDFAHVPQPIFLDDVSRWGLSGGFNF